MAYRVKKQDGDDEATCWYLLQGDGQPVHEAERFLHALMLRGLASRTRRTYAYDLLCAYRWMEEAGLSANELSGERFLDFIEYQLRTASASPSTINRRLRLLQRLVTYLVGTTPVIPAWQHQHHALTFHARARRGSMRLKEPHRVVKPLTDAEAVRFYQSLSTWRDRTMVLLMWLQGLRSAEVLELRLQDIDIHTGSLRVLGKGRKERVIPLAETVIKALLLYVRLERPTTPSPVTFLVMKGSRRGQHMNLAGLRSVFRYHRTKSGVAHANPHRLRHSFGANMTRCGVPVLILAKMMGHSSPQTTMRYVELEDEELRACFLKALDSLQTESLLDVRDP
jgi:integrase/recombinase XerD